MMNGLSLGEHSKLTVPPSQRDRIRTFYEDVLGCVITRKSDAVDVFKIGASFYLAAVYDDAALSESQSFKSIWLELRTDNPAELKARILAFGIAEIDYWDKEHFYFQAPGGQVFRLAPRDDDMSRFES